MSIRAPLSALSAKRTEQLTRRVFLKQVEESNNLELLLHYPGGARLLSLDVASIRGVFPQQPSAEACQCAYPGYAVCAQTLHTA
jgi:hypothetical protein